MIVATMNATADGDRSAGGEIAADSKGYSVTVDENRVGHVGTLRAAAERLQHAVGDRLPRDPARWGVQITCPRTGVSGGVGNYPGAGRPPHPCVARVLGNSTPRTLREALNAMARVIADCCE